MDGGEVRHIFTLYTYYLSACLDKEAAEVVHMWSNRQPPDIFRIRGTPRAESLAFLMAQ